MYELQDILSEEICMHHSKESRAQTVRVFQLRISGGTSFRDRMNVVVASSAIARFATKTNSAMKNLGSVFYVRNFMHTFAVRNSLPSS